MTANIFTPFVALGYPNLVPVIPPDAPISAKSSLFKRIGTKQDARGKVPGVKGRDGNWFSFDWINYAPDDKDFDRWHGMGAGVGMRTGEGLIAIDADTTDERLALIIRDAVIAMTGKTPVRVGRHPKALYVLRVNGAFKYQRIEFGQRDENDKLTERVEVLSDGKHFVAEGIHPKTQKPYTWPRALVPFAELPIVTPARVTQFLDELRPLLPASSPVIMEGASTTISQSSLRGELDMVRRAVEAIPNTSALFPSRESYRDMLYAIKAALPDDPIDALGIAEDWTDRWEDGDNDRGVVEADWSRMKPPYRRGAQWLYELAEKHAPERFNVGEVWFENLEAPDNPFQAIELNSQNSDDRAKSSKFRFEGFADVVTQELAFAPHLIDGLLDQGTMSVVYGDSNVGKTFVTMDMAFHIGAGLPYAGMDVARGLVVYVAAEGGNGAKKRLVALREKFPGVTPDFVLLASPVDLRRPDADIVPLAEAIRALGQPVALLVIDTLSRAMAGGDENSSVDMGALVKHFDVLRQATQPSHLMVVHHTGKVAAKGARGHSLLRAATDTEIEIAKPGKDETGPATITVTKQRDMDGEWSSPFKLRVHTLGVKPNGRPITSCTVELIGAAEARALSVRPTEKERAVLNALDDLSQERGEGEFSTEEIAAQVSDDLSKPALEAMRKNLGRMASKGLIVKSGTKKWEKIADKSPLSAAGAGAAFLEPLDENGQGADSGIFN